VIGQHRRRKPLMKRRDNARLHKFRELLHFPPGAVTTGRHMNPAVRLHG
jgi:hypothetical protein